MDIVTREAVVQHLEKLAHDNITLSNCAKQPQKKFIHLVTEVPDMNSHTLLILLDPNKLPTKIGM